MWIKLAQLIQSSLLFILKHRKKKTLFNYKIKKATDK